MDNRRKIQRIMLGAALLAGAALAGCSEEETLREARGGNGEAVRILARPEGGLSSRSNPADDSRSEAFNSGDKISVAAGGQTARTYTLTNGEWTTTGEPLLWESYTMVFTAFYPVTEGTTASTFSVPADQSTEENIAAADYMTYSGSLSPDSDNSAPLALSRRTTRIRVTIAGFSKNLAEGTVVKSLTIGSGQTIGTDEGNTVAVSPLVNGDGGTGTTYTALIAPGAPADNFITVTTTDAEGNNEQTFTANPAAGTTFEAGKSYAYDLTVRKPVGTKPDEATIAVGDYYMNDGTVVSSTAFETLSDLDKACCIGIVFSTADESRVDDATKQALKDKGTTYHGLVMALTNASKGCRWGSYGTDENSAGEDGAPFKTNTSTLTAQWGNVGGYSETKWIIDNHGTEEDFQTTYTAFYAAQQYGKSDDTKTYAAPEKSTGWFIPSMGQWWTIVENLGGQDLSSYKERTGTDTYISGAATTVVNKLNSYLNKVSVAETFDIGTWFWSSSEYDGDRAFCVDFYSDSDDDLHLGWYNKDSTDNRVRCVLAF